MDYKKELLLFVATTFVGIGATQMGENIYAGSALLLIGALIFVGRGFYKKYLSK